MLAGLLLALVLGGGAFGLQAAALRHPRRADLIGSATLAGLTHIRMVDGVQHIGGRVAASSCLRAGADASGVTLAGGSDLVDVAGRVVVRGRLPAPAGAELTLAACPAVLARRLGNRLTMHLLRLRSVRADGQRSYDLILGERPRIDLFVARTTLLPIAVRVRTRSLEAWSDVEVRRPAPRVLDRFRRAFAGRVDALRDAHGA